MDTTSTTPADGGRRKPLKEQALGGYWRVPVFALAGAVIAFTVSFAFKSEYPSVARLLIRTGETSYSSTDSAASLGDGINIGGIDITKQQTLGNTLTNLALSREAAEEIVERIGMDRINGGEVPELGLTSKIINFIKVGGTGSAPTPEDAAVAHVQGALEAVVLDESWVMEITAWDPDPELAKELADTAAEVSVDQSEERFRENSLRELNFLNGQIETARADVAAKAQAVAQFKSANGIITDTTGESLASVLGNTSASSLDQLNNQLVGLRAREAVLRDQLAGTPRTVTATSVGLDGQPVRSQQPNPEYDLRSQALESLQADIAVAEAQFNDLAGRLGGGTAGSVNEINAQLTTLQSDLQLSQEAYATLNDRYRAVAATVDKPRFDASRLGTATVAGAPGRPARYIFLLVGALVGALAGLLITWFRSIREEDEAAARERDRQTGAGGGDGDGPGGPRVASDEFDALIVDVREPLGRPVVVGNGAPAAPAQAPQAPQYSRGAEALPVHGVLSQSEAQGLTGQVPPVNPADPGLR